MNFWANEEARQVEAGNPVYAGHDWSRPLRSLTYKELESRLAESIEAVQQIREMAEAHAESKGQYPQTAMGYIVARCDAVLASGGE